MGARRGLLMMWGLALAGLNTAAWLLAGGLSFLSPVWRLGLLMLLAGFGFILALRTAPLHWLPETGADLLIVWAVALLGVLPALLDGYAYLAGALALANAVVCWLGNAVCSRRLWILHEEPG